MVFELTEAAKYIGTNLNFCSAKTEKDCEESTMPSVVWGYSFKNRCKLRKLPLLPLFTSTGNQFPFF